jgi:serine protease Do
MTRHTRIRRSIIAGVCAVGVAAGVGLVARTTSPGPAHAQALAPGSTQISDVAERVVDSVVNVSTTQQVATGPFAADPFWNDPSSPFYGGDDPRKAQSLGSGVIVSSDGRVLTNAHVIDNAASIRVTLRDGVELDAKLIGSDPRSDVAVLQLIPAKGQKLPALKPITIGDSSKLRLGEVVLAVGNPFGVGQAVTMGIVSAVGRASVGIEEYEDFIQTDAAINPGNSGGALVDMNGNLIGINTAILSRTGGYQGIGFAIPTNMARPIMDMLVKDGRVSRGYLGVGLAPLDQAARDQFGIKAPSGVVIGSVGRGTPAAKAGLAAGDLVTAIDGAPVREVGKLRNAVATRGAGKTVKLDVVRGGVAKSVSVTLSELPERQVAQAQPQPRIVPPRQGGAMPPSAQWRREEIIIHPDGRVERRTSSDQDPQPTP